MLMSQNGMTVRKIDRKLLRFLAKRKWVWGTSLGYESGVWEKAFSSILHNFFQVNSTFKTKNFSFLMWENIVRVDHMITQTLTGE
jgi:hypothetical protein